MLRYGEWKGGVWRFGCGGRASGAKSISCHHRGMVEGTPVNDNILDTGCVRTLVGEYLVTTTKKMSGEAITLRCTHSRRVGRGFLDARKPPFSASCGEFLSRCDGGACRHRDQTVFPS